MARTSLYDDATFATVDSRVKELRADTSAQWGTMSPAQMCSHCSEVLEVATGKQLDETPFFIRLLGPLIKKLVLSDKPYPKSTRTHPQYVMSSERDFDAERERLSAAIEAFRASDGSVRHPIFGQMNREESGWAAYKHLDHHLRQFGL